MEDVWAIAIAAVVAVIGTTAIAVEIRRELRITAREREQEKLEGNRRRAEAVARTERYIADVNNARTADELDRLVDNYNQSPEKDQ